MFSSVLRFHLDLADGKLWIRSRYVFSSYCYVRYKTKTKREKKKKHKNYAKESSKLIMERWTHWNKYKCGKSLRNDDHVLNWTISVYVTPWEKNKLFTESRCVASTFGRRCYYVFGLVRYLFLYLIIREEGKKSTCFWPLLN